MKLDALLSAQDDRSHLIRCQMDIIEKAKAESRELTSGEVSEIEALRARVKNSDAEIENLKKGRRLTVEVGDDLAALSVPEQRMVRPGDPGDYGGSRTTPEASSEWTTSKGERVYMLRPEQRLQDLPSRFASYDQREVRFGRMIRALVRGDWTGAESEKRAMSTTLNSGGGFLVPDGLANQIIDLARNQSVLMRAGCQTIPMDTGTLSIAKVLTDATMETKTENASFTGSDMVFGSQLLNAYTIGTVITLSRELCEDAPNVVQIIESALAAALAQQLDKFGLVGTGSAQPLGIMRHPSVQTTTSAGTATYDLLLAAIKKVQDYNGVADTYVTTPALALVLAELKTGDGTNAAKFYMPAPDGVKALTPLVSNQVASGETYLGDFKNCVMGIRTAAQVEVSSVAGSAFEKHQTLIKCTWRGDFAPLQPSHLVCLSGMS